MAVRRGNRGRRHCSRRPARITGRPPSAPSTAPQAMTRNLRAPGRKGTARQSGGRQTDHPTPLLPALLVCAIDGQQGFRLSGQAAFRIANPQPPLTRIWLTCTNRKRGIRHTMQTTVLHASASIRVWQTRYRWRKRSDGLTRGRHWLSPPHGACRHRRIRLSHPEPGRFGARVPPGAGSHATGAAAVLRAGPEDMPGVPDARAMPPRAEEAQRAQGRTR